MGHRADDSIIRFYDSTATACGCSVGDKRRRALFKRLGLGAATGNPGVPAAPVRRQVQRGGVLLTCLMCETQWHELPGHGPTDPPPAVRPRALRRAA